MPARLCLGGGFSIDHLREIKQLSFRVARDHGEVQSETDWTTKQIFDVVPLPRSPDLRCCARVRFGPRQMAKRRFGPGRRFFRCLDPSLRLKQNTISRFLTIGKWEGKVKVNSPLLRCVQAVLGLT